MSKQLEMRCQLGVLLAKQRPKISQRHLSESTGLSTHTISQLVQDKVKRVDYSTVEKLCGFFECSIAELFELREVTDDD